MKFNRLLIATIVVYSNDDQYSRPVLAVDSAMMINAIPGGLSGHVDSEGC
jgi:hypothetical protein